MNFTRAFIAVALLVSSSLSMAIVINPEEDVMTSSFFFPSGGPDAVRGYAGESKTTFRVSTDNAFGVSGGETVYIAFSAADIAGLTAGSATLTVQSVSGGFNQDAGAGNPFTVSAHAVNANPLTSIIDDTNPGGSTSWFDFYDNNILAADAAASTVIDSFDTYTFDVSAIVADWISGANTIFAIALTGKNDISGNDFLHGFLNNSETPGSTFLTVAAVPIPAAVWLFGSALMGLIGVGRTRQTA